MSRPFSRVVLTVACALFATAELSAQDSEEPTPGRGAPPDAAATDARDDVDVDDDVDEVVIVATRTPLLTFDAPYQVERVRRLSDDAILPPRTVTDALEGMPQVMVQKTGYGQASPYLRGFTGFRTLILVDGIRLNNSVFRDGPNQYATLIDPNAVERGEVVFGPSSVLYGSDAIGGTMSYTLRTPDYAESGTEAGGRIFQRYASAEASSVTRVEATTATEDLAVVVGGSYRDFGDVTAGRHQGQLENTGYREWTGDAKLRARVADDVELTFAYQRHDQDDVPRTHSTIYGQSYRGTTVGSDFRRDLSELRELAFARAAWEPTIDRRLELTVYRYLLDEEENRIRSNGRLRQQGFDDVMLGANLHYSDVTSIGRLSGGVEIAREDVNSFYREYETDGSLLEERLRGPVADDALYDTVSVYLEDRFDVTQDLELSVGGRFTYVQVDADDVDPDPLDAEVFQSIDEDFSDFVGSVRGLYRVTEDVNVFAGVSQAFRAPNLSDLTRFDAARSGEAEIPSTDLDPERFLTFEIGGRTRRGRFEFGASYYYTVIRDLIIRFPTGTTNTDGDDVVTKDNIGDGFAHGIELDATVDLPHDLSAYGGFSWVDGEAETFIAPGVKSDEPLSRLAPPQGVIGLRYEPAGTTVRIEFDVRIAGDADELSPRDVEDTQRIPPGGTPGYAVAGLRGSWEPRPGVRLFVGVENLTDQDYRIHGSGSNEPGTNFVTGVDWTF